MILHPNVKLNLGLYVLERRVDGYHNLETLFIPYSGIADELEILPSEEFSISIEKEGGADWDPQQDLCAKAWRLLRDEYGIPAVSIRLVKNAPVGAGLGGGSSDAAFTLRALNDLFSLGLPAERLAACAARLGSDCAFFVYNTPMLGCGRGEILEPFDIDLSGYEIRVAVPAGVAVSTREAYSGIVPAIPQIPLREALSRGVREWKDCLFNDFEKTVFPLHPQIAELKEKFYAEGAVYAAMSGSGSAVFGIFEK